MKNKKDTTTIESLLDKIIQTKEDERVERYKLVYDLLMITNPKAKREAEKVAKDCASVRDEKLFSNKKSKHAGLKFGVAMPPLTWRALIETDERIFGHSELHHPSKEMYKERDGSNQLVRELMEAFPQFKVRKA